MLAFISEAHWRRAKTLSDCTLSAQCYPVLQSAYYSAIELSSYPILCSLHTSQIGKKCTWQHNSWKGSESCATTRASLATSHTHSPLSVPYTSSLRVHAFIAWLIQSAISSYAGTCKLCIVQAVRCGWLSGLPGWSRARPLVCVVQRGACLPPDTCQPIATCPAHMMVNK